MRRRTLGIVATAGILVSLLCLPATAQAQPATPVPSYGSVNSAVVPSPMAPPPSSSREQTGLS